MTGAATWQWATMRVLAWNGRGCVRRPVWGFVRFPFGVAQLGVRPGFEAGGRPSIRACGPTQDVSAEASAEGDERDPEAEPPFVWGIVHLQSGLIVGEADWSGEACGIAAALAQLGDWSMPVAPDLEHAALRILRHLGGRAPGGSFEMGAGPSIRPGGPTQSPPRADAGDERGEGA